MSGVKLDATEVERLAGVVERAFLSAPAHPAVRDAVTSNQWVAARQEDNLRRWLAAVTALLADPAVRAAAWREIASAMRLPETATPDECRARAVGLTTMDDVWSVSDEGAAWRAGAEAMREAAAKVAARSHCGAEIDWPECDAAIAVLALPLPPYPGGEGERES